MPWHNPFIKSEEKSALGERSGARRESVRRRVVRQDGASRAKKSQLLTAVLKFFAIFLGFDKILLPKAPELSWFSRLRFKNLAGAPQTPKMECPRVTYDSSEAVPAF